MIIVDKNAEIIDWLASLDLDLGGKRLDPEVFEMARGIESELIIVNDLILNNSSPNFVAKLESCYAVLIYSSKESVESKLPFNFVGMIHPHLNSEVVANQIHNIENLVKDNTLLKSQMISMGMELTSLMQGVESQLIRVKHAYEKVAPKRLEEFPGFKIFSKYAAGENMGGEFFDLFARDEKVFIMMSNTSSYLASSALLQLFTELKINKTVSEKDEVNFIKSVKEQISDLAKSQKKPIQAQLMTCVLNTKTMKMRGHLLGNFRIVSSNLEHNFESESSIDMEVEQTSFSRDIERGERLMFCSPGFVMNWQSMSPKFLIENIITDKKIKVLDILDEVFFQLKKEAENGFLKSDASSIILEVGQNVMLEI